MKTAMIDGALYRIELKESYADTEIYYVEGNGKGWPSDDKLIRACSPSPLGGVVVREIDANTVQVDIYIEEVI